MSYKIVGKYIKDLKFTIADPTTEAAFKVARVKFQIAEEKFTELIKKPEYADLSKYSKEKLFNTT